MMNEESQNRSKQLQKARQKQQDIKNGKKETNEIQTSAATLTRQKQFQQKVFDEKFADYELQHKDKMKELDEREEIIKLKEAESLARLAVKESTLNEREKLIQDKERALDQRQQYLEDLENSLNEKHADEITTTPIRRSRGRGKTLKPYLKLCDTQKRKREAEAKRLDVPLPPDPTAALQLIIDCAIPQKTVRQVNAVSPKFFPSEYTYQKEKNNILAAYNWENAATVGNENDKVISFAQSLIHRITNIGPEKMPSFPQVTIGVDSGDHLNKIGFFFNNVLKPQSYNNFLELAVSHDPEKYEYIKEIFHETLKDFSLLNDLTINDQHIIFEFFFVADLKGICTCFGHQGPSATYFCIWCYITKTPIIGPINLRTINDIIECGRKAEAMRVQYGETSVQFKNFCKLENYSISRMPLIDFIPLTHVVPPPVHIKIGSTNYTLKEATKHDKPAVDKLLRDCKINVKFPSQNLTGGDASKMLQMIAEGDVEYKGYGVKLFHLLYEIDEEFTECRDYNDKELDIFEEIIREVRIVIYEDYPELRSSQHLHDLVEHVPQFFRLHKSWARYGEESLERSHQKIKRDGQHLKRGDKAAYAHKQSILRTAYSDKAAQV